MDIIKILIDIVELIAIISAAIAAIVNIRKFRDARSVDFIINAEMCLDPAYLRIMDENESTIQRAFGKRIEDIKTKEELRLYVYFFYHYSQVSRMYFLLKNKKLDLGMPTEMRKETIDAWLNHLKGLAEDPIFLRVHEDALKYKDFNPDFLKHADFIISNVNPT